MDLERAKEAFPSCQAPDVEAWSNYLLNAPEGVWHQLVAEMVKAAVATESDERRIGRRPRPNATLADVVRITEGNYSEEPFREALVTLLAGRSIRGFAARVPMNPAYLGRLVTGERPPPSPSTMAAIARAARVPASYFLEYRIAAVQEIIGSAMTSRPALSITGYKRVASLLGG